uniref:DUF4371 domain-containing protein n=1 Tax=Amphimedon queenslandica TaxID=400682 RepID=A0A1X7VAA5_AMPQE
MLCATQEIALRGHREVASKNKGNFLTILGLVGKHDSIVASRLSDGPRNASYTSHSIQNELLHLLAKNVQKVICDQVKNAGYYSIIVDECRDLAKREQLSFCVRYVIVNTWGGVFYRIYPHELPVESLKIAHEAEGRVRYF